LNVSSVVSVDCFSSDNILLEPGLHVDLISCHSLIVRSTHILFVNTKNSALASIAYRFISQVLVKPGERNIRFSIDPRSLSMNIVAMVFFIHE
jgi:hypothetical protein